jgi:hypothetical protein
LLDLDPIKVQVQAVIAQAVDDIFAILGGLALAAGTPAPKAAGFATFSFPRPRLDDRILDFIRAHPDLSAREIAQGMFGQHATQQRVHNNLLELLHRGLVTRELINGAYRWRAV